MWRITFSLITRWTVSCLSFAALAVSSVYAQPTWVSFDGSDVQEKPSAVVQWSNDQETVVEFTIKGMFVEEVTEEGQTFQVMRFPYYYTTLEVGKPQLPAITEMFGIPGDANVRARVIDATVMTLDDYTVYPFQTPLSEMEERVGFDIDRELYARDLFYPEQTVEVGEPGIWRDIRVVSLRVYPIQYNPATSELRIYRKVTVKLEYYGTSHSNVLPPSKRPISPRHDEMYRSTILNYDFLDLNKGGGSKQDYDYLIIAVDQFVDEVAPLEVWKEWQNIETEIVPLSEIGANPASIREHIDQEYDDHNIQYVLLVGDDDDLPMYDYTDPEEHDTYKSDFWYALLDGDDLLPEIAIGRFSANSGPEVTTMVSKSVNFEQNLPPGDWRTKALLVANLELAPGKYQRCKQQIRDATDTQSWDYRNLEPDFSTAYGATEANEGDNATNQDVIDAIDDGRLVVNYRGHGSPTSWHHWNNAGQSFTTADVANLANGNKTPVVFSIACWNNKLHEAGQCLGEAFTRSAQGAVAFLGATFPSRTNANHTYDKQLFATIFDEGNINIGHASNIAAIRIMEDHEHNGERNAMMYLWLGDPSLVLPVDPDYVSHWLVLLDTTGSMVNYGRIEAAKAYATWKVRRILQDPDDMVALATFAGSQPFNLHFDWTRDEEGLMARIEDLSTGGMTPLADAACEAVEMLNDVPVPPEHARRLVLITDGEENYSSGDCAGNPPSHPDPMPNPPWCDHDGEPEEEFSWHCKVWRELLGNLIVDVAYFGNLGPVKGGSEAMDDPSPRDTTDEKFFKDLADSTGGEYYDPESTVVCGNGILEFGEQCEVGYPCGSVDADDTVYSCVDCHCEPLAVDLLSFAAHQHENMIEVEWTTAAEIDNAGFNVHRGLSKEGPYAQINHELIPAIGSAIEGATYSFIDEDVAQGITYYYWLEDVDLHGTGIMHGPVSATPGQSSVVEGNPPIPTSFCLPQNYPNPFNAITEIRFGLPEEVDVRLAIYNLQGQKVKTLTSERQTPGYKIVSWDGRNEAEEPVSSGIYFYRLQAGDYTRVRRMILLK